MYAYGGETIQELNLRYVHCYPVLQRLEWQHSYCKIPTFGRDTIQKFSDNVSALTKLAARDFEDLLQVSATFFLPFFHTGYQLVCDPGV